MQRFYRTSCCVDNSGAVGYNYKPLKSKIMAVFVTQLTSCISLKLFEPVGGTGILPVSFSAGLSQRWLRGEK
ncbi:hypothetical protein [Moorena sp. SIO4A5]|uniref:hypothetical protein n=1 Tax=Moorena sp. SIO4A5 TaxID=2607838 RepID=UPI0013CA80DE|nr:hypothetical protein [Moorena sp. SIO4A5]NEO24846.1 hypothetical protein [Moorena sp. SIO4A5]